MTARAELSAIATALDELRDRVGRIASELAGDERDELEVGLADVERSLDVTRRRLARLVGGRR